MRATTTIILLGACVLSLSTREQDGTIVFFHEPIARRTADSGKVTPPSTSDNEAGVLRKQASRVFLTHRKAWLASGGFTSNQETGDASQHSKPHTPAPDFTTDFHKHCPQVLITDVQDTADYAVTIDEIGFVDSLTKPDAPTFQVSVYSHSAGLIYTGGTSFLKNAIKDACSAMGAK